MKLLLSVLITCCFVIITFGQKNKKSIQNLDFELIENGQAKGWKIFGEGDYKLEIDSLIYKSGKKSALIEFNGGTPNFKAWAYTIPAIYQGKKIKLSGFIKTENVTDGFAGLWMRIDPYINFNNMKDRGIKGTTDWTKYEIELELKASLAEKIVVGGLLAGKGKMWIDQLEVTIDGKKLKRVPIKKIPKAKKDTVFDAGSKISSIDLNEQKIEDLKMLGLAWGFLKYHHPNIALGNMNWDYELFRVLPGIINSKSSKERDNCLTRWVKKIGRYKLQKKAPVVDQNTKIKPDLDWITTSNFHTDLVAELTNVKNAKRIDTNYYLGLQKGVGNPDFKNEARYLKMKYPDVGFRLLSLFRYWNVIQYYFPYKDLIEEDWKDVLSEFIPKFVHAKNEIEYKLAVLELIARIHDTHANIWSRDPVLTNYWGENYAPIEVKFIEEKVIVSDFFDKKLGQETGLVIGDHITKINDEPISDILNEKLKYTPASNYPTQLRDIANKLLRTNAPTIDIEFVRDGQTKNTTIKTFTAADIHLYERYHKKDTCFKFINDEIAYLYPGSIKNEYLPDLFSKFEHTKGLIIDLRCYPSDFIVFTLGKYLMPKNTPFVKFSTGSITEAGKFTLSDNLAVGKNNKDYYKGKIIILINETTQSNAEYTTMAFRVAPKATVIGSTTSGADGNVSKFWLPGNIQTMISGIGIYYPDNTATQRVGIVPDIEIKPTIEGIKNNKDELLEKAIELINN